MNKSLLVMSFVLGVVSSAGAQDVEIYGPKQNGTYRAGRDRIVYFVARVRGDFEFDVAERAAYDAVQQYKDRGETSKADLSTEEMQLGRGEFGLIGFENSSEGRWKWYAVQMPNANNSQYLDSGHGAGSSGGWISKSIYTGEDEDHVTVIHFADDDDGNLIWRFESPRANVKIEGTKEFPAEQETHVANDKKAEKKE